MSSVVINGDTSGSITLQAPAVAGTNTLTLPTQTATLAFNGPAFSAYQSSSQTLSNETDTKIQFQSEEFDTANCFDNATNYRFTPDVAGYYQTNAAIRTNSSLANTALSLIVFKNGSAYKRGVTFRSGSTATILDADCSCLVYLNGTTDYIELYGWQSSGSSQALSATSQGTYFQAALVRAA